MHTTHDTRSQVLRKVNLAIQLVRETGELLKASNKSTPAPRPRFSRRSSERSE
jgi:hypothetical protein